MGNPAWRLAFPLAFVQHGAFEAEVDLARPDLGLHHALLGRQDLGSVQMLGADVAAAQSVARAAAADFCHCDCDLTAVYAETAERAIQIDLRWRMLRLPEFPSVRVAVELVASARTSALHCPAHLQVCSIAPADELWGLVEDGWRLQQLPRQELRIEGQSPTLGLVLHRPDSDLFYFEMVHPNDRVAVAVEQAVGLPGGLRITSTLFSTSLEKGVILRSRVQGAWLDGAALEETCRRLFERFVDADPPLGA